MGDSTNSPTCHNVSDNQWLTCKRNSKQNQNKNVAGLQLSRTLRFQAEFIRVIFLQVHLYQHICEDGNE